MGIRECDTWLDYQIEQECMREWEAQNPPAPADPIESVSTHKRISSHAQIYTACFLLGLALEDIEEGIEFIKNTPQADKLAGMYDQLSDFIYDLKKVDQEVWKTND